MSARPSGGEPQHNEAGRDEAPLDEFGPTPPYFVGLGTAPPASSQATKATQMATMFAAYLRPGIGGPHCNRNSVP